MAAKRKRKRAKKDAKRVERATELLARENDPEFIAAEERLAEQELKEGIAAEEKPVRRETVEVANEFHRAVLLRDEPWAQLLTLRYLDTEDRFSGFRVELVHQGQGHEIIAFPNPEAVAEVPDVWDRVLKKAATIYEELQREPPASDEAAIEQQKQAAAAERQARIDRSYGSKVAEGDAVLAAQETVAMMIPPNLDGTNLPFVDVQRNRSGVELRVRLLCGQINNVPAALAGDVQELIETMYLHATPDAAQPGVMRMVGTSGDAAAALAAQPVDRSIPLPPT